MPDRRPVRVGAVAGAVLLAALALHAQGGAPAGAPAPRPMIPTTAASIVLNPDAHWGENVSMMCAVESMLSKTVFTVDQDRTASTGKEVLVIAPYLQMPVLKNAYVTVQGEVFKFDPAEVARRARDGYVLDLPPDLAARYQGRPAVFATGVITGELVDIGKRLPPPLTPAEVALREAMIQINTTNTALRGGLATPDAAAIKGQITALKTAFTAADGFFKSQNAADAVGWTAEALQFLATMEAAAGAATPRWDDVRTGATGVGGLCAPCHNARRERLEDGSFRFRR